MAFTFFVSSAIMLYLACGIVFLKLRWNEFQLHDLSNETESIYVLEYVFSIIMWPLFLIGVIFGGFLKILRIMLLKIFSDSSEPLPDYKWIVKDVLKKKEILPTLMGINRDLDREIEKILKR